MEQTVFYIVDTDSQKLKANQKFIGKAWSQMGMSSQVMGY